MTVKWDSVLLSRYESLSSGVSSRGKLLNSGMASLQSFQPSADRFCSWLTSVEEAAAKLESSGEKLRAQYGDQSIPEEELKPFKVRKERGKKASWMYIVEGVKIFSLEFKVLGPKGNL